MFFTELDAIMLVMKIDQWINLKNKVKKIKNKGGSYILGDVTCEMEQCAFVVVFEKMFI